MFRQFFTITINNLLKDKVFSCINLTNLVVGFATFILLSLFINEELNYDKLNNKYDRIYRLQLFQDAAENVVQHASSVTAAICRQILPGLPEIEKVALIHDAGDNNKNGIFLSTDKKNQFLTRFGYYADQSVFEILDFKFVEGNQSESLSKPYSIVLSKTLAEKLFPNRNGVGKVVYGENKVVLTVTGVYEDLPENSSWKPTYIVSMTSFGPITGWTDYENNFWAYSFYTYVLLKNYADPASVDKKIHDALKNYRKNHYPYLRPLSQLHINPYFQPDMYIVLGLFYLIAILILVLSSINFINMQIANATNRFREIGIKKTVGFTRNSLWFQFVLEAIFVTIIAGILGFMLAYFSVPGFNNIMGKTAISGVFNSEKLIFIIFTVTILTGLLSGLYPAYIISSYNPVKALKQKYLQDNQSKLSFKKILITAQFSISLFLLLVSFIIYRQTYYMINRNMGFDSNNLLFDDITTNKIGTFDPIRERLLKHPEIEAACFSDYIPFMLPGGDELSWEGAQTDEKVFIRFSNISYDFVPTYKMNMLYGRNFSREFPTDREKCLINETAVKIFNWDNPIGKRVHLWNRDIEVIGVISDYVAFSVHNTIEPHLYRLLSDSLKLQGVFTIRFKKGQEMKAKQITSMEFAEMFPLDVFEFSNFQNLIIRENALKSWEVFRNICIFFAILSIIISCIGLFGLIVFFTKRKTKEIGIRKVFGFSKFQLFNNLSSMFVPVILLSNIFAWPAGYYIYKILPTANKYPIEIYEFLLASVILLIVTYITLTWHILRAMRINPVEILKYE